MRTGVYTGKVMHQRLRPRRHRLEYRVFCLLIDLDELPVLDGKFPLLGINRPGLFSFRETDHGDGGGDLKAWASGLLADGGIAYDGGRIEMLCYPRILGYVFNPLTVYFCHNRDGALSGILYEVHNTHGEAHTYVLPANAESGVVRHEAAKQFFVSPFMPPDCLYRFKIAPPGERVSVSIREDDPEGLLLTATFNGRREELSNDLLRKLFFAYPLMTVKVVVGIHWEAVKLVAKRMPIFGFKPAKQRVAVSLPERKREVA